MTAKLGQKAEKLLTLFFQGALNLPQTNCYSLVVNWVKDLMIARRCAEARKAPGMHPRNTVNYHQINQIGILFHLQPEVNAEPLAQFIKKLEYDHKKLKILTFFEHVHSHPYNFYIDYFLKSDISWLGHINTPKVKQFTDTPFDFLFCIESEPQPVFDIILSQTRANCRVGLFDEKRTNLFELMVQNPDPANLEHTLQQMLNYTKLLIYND